MNPTWCREVIRLLSGTYRCGTPLDEEGRCVNAVHHVANETPDEAAHRLHGERVREPGR